MYNIYKAQNNTMYIIKKLKYQLTHKAQNDIIITIILYKEMEVYAGIKDKRKPTKSHI